MSAEGRWELLRESLVTLGVDVTIAARSSVNGSSHSIAVRPANAAAVVHVGDRWWSKNPEVWIGWEVFIQLDSTGLGRTWPISKSRLEVAKTFKLALGLVTPK